MELITRILRIYLATETLLGITLGAVVWGGLVIGCLIAGYYLAAATFAAMLLIVGAIYGRYWRRYPLKIFRA